MSAAHQAIAVATMDPRAISGLRVWLDASASNTLFDATSGGSLVSAGSSVARIEDRSGNSHHAIQSTSGNRPLRIAGAQNGRDVLRFDGTNDSLQVASIALNTHISIYVAARATTAKPMLIEHGPNAGGTNGFFIYGHTNSAWAFRRDSASHYAFGTTNWMGSTFCVICVTYDGSGAFYRNNVVGSNGSVVGTARTNSSTANTLNIFARNQASVFGEGDLGELLIYHGAHTAAERQLIYTHLSRRWGVS